MKTLAHCRYTARVAAFFAFIAVAARPGVAVELQLSDGTTLSGDTLTDPSGGLVVQTMFGKIAVSRSDIDVIDGRPYGDRSKPPGEKQLQSTAPAARPAPASPEAVVQEDQDADGIPGEDTAHAAPTQTPRAGPFTPPAQPAQSPEPPAAAAPPPSQPAENAAPLPDTAATADHDAAVPPDSKPVAAGASPQAAPPAPEKPRAASGNA
ncbi:MAG: hypothetical protein GF331_18715, partial [Chitinivibrionales bacterium]|nr:hypothetical protein [Chitinivibrionales bacterium]